MFSKVLSVLTSTGLAVGALSPFILVIDPYKPAEASSKHSSFSTEITAREQRLYVENPVNLNLSFERSNTNTVFLLLARPLKDHAGNVIIPEGADVLAIVEATDNGVEFTAQKILVEGMEISIDAISHTIPIQERVVRTKTEKITDFLAYSRPIGHAVGGLFFDDTYSGELAGTVLPLLIGALFTEADIERGVFIPADQQMPLKVQESITLPLEVAQAIHGHNSPQLAQILNYADSRSRTLPIISQKTNCSNQQPELMSNKVSVFCK